MTLQERSAEWVRLGVGAAGRSVDRGRRWRQCYLPEDGDVRLDN
jgi:hypothetical protein